MRAPAPAALTEARALLAALPLPSMLVGQTARILAANARAQSLLQAPLQDRHVLSVLRQPQAIDAIDAALAGAEFAQGRYLGADDTEYRLTCSRLELGSVSGILVCLLDFTPQLRAEAQRRDFVANVSHELRTPLTALIGFIDTLRGPARDDPAARARFLDIMAREAGRMSTLVQDLLSLSRVETEERRRPRDKVDLHDCCQRALQLVEAQAQQAGVRLNAELDDAPVIMPGDANQIVQVLSNLLENAVNYGAANGAVTLTLGRVERAPHLRGPAAVITVSDTGAGIAAHHLPRLTERFYRVNADRARDSGGTGLGLAIVKHIVNRHRGHLGIESTPCAGSRFSVFLPESAD